MSHSLAGSTDTSTSIRNPEHLVSVVSYGHSVGCVSFGGYVIIHGVIDQEELVAPLLNTFAGFTERHGSERLTWCTRSVQCKYRNMSMYVYISVLVDNHLTVVQEQLCINTQYG